MHLKSIPDHYAREIKSRAMSLGMSPSEYFVHLYLKDIGQEHSEKSSQKSKKKRKK